MLAVKEFASMGALRAMFNPCAVKLFFGSIKVCVDEELAIYL